MSFIKKIGSIDNILGISILALFGLSALVLGASGAVPGISGWTGIYNTTSTDLTLRDGQSAAAQIDRQGRILVSPSSSIVMSTIGTSANPIPNAYFTNATATNFTVTGQFSIPVGGNALAPFGINSSSPGSDFVTACTGGRPCMTIASGTTNIIQTAGTGSNTTTFFKPVIMTQAQFGPLNFVPDSGMQDWVNVSVTSLTANNVTTSYSAKIDDVKFLTIAALSDGSGGIKNHNLKFGRANVSTVIYVGTADGCSAYTYAVSTTNPTPTATTTANCN
jgi:hypothetical protein